MKKFKVEIIRNENKEPIGIRAAQVNGRDINIALKDAKPCDWYKAVKLGIPSRVEMDAIYENKEAVNKALLKAGGEPLKDGWYWSSSEYDNGYAWTQGFNSGSVTSNSKTLNSNYVRPVLAL